MTTSLEQVSADVTAMQSARTELNDADVALQGGVPIATYAKMHPFLAKVSGTLTAAQTAANAWVKTNTPPVTPPVTPPAPSGPIFGTNNSNEENWFATSAWDMVPVQALGAKIYRVNLISDATAGKAIPFGSTTCINVIKAEVSDYAAFGCKIAEVVTWSGSTLPSASTFAANMATIVKACPGLIWELGNELDLLYSDEASQKAGGAAYAPWYVTVATAILAADPTAVVCPSPVANINSGGSGWNWEQGFLGALTPTQIKTLIKVLTFHNYPWPGDDSPTTNWSGSQNALTVITAWLSLVLGLGWTGPNGLTECGWATDATVTQPIQAQFLTEFLTSPLLSSLIWVLVYQISDVGDNQTFGLIDSSGNKKQAFAAVEAIFKAGITLGV